MLVVYGHQSTLSTHVDKGRFAIIPTKACPSSCSFVFRFITPAARINVTTHRWPIWHKHMYGFARIEGTFLICVVRSHAASAELSLTLHGKKGG